MTIAPWLIPPDFIGAASRGAALGLQRAQLESEAAQAADRLRFSYAQLSGENQARADATASRQQEANAALALRAQLAAQSDVDRDAALAEVKRQHDAQQAYQTGELGIRTAAEARQEKKATAADALRKGIEEASGKFLNDVNAGTDTVTALGKNPAAIHDPTVRSLVVQNEIAKREKTLQEAMTGRAGARLNPVDRLRYSDALAGRRRLESQLLKVDTSDQAGQDAAFALKNQMLPYLKTIKEVESGRSGVPGLPPASRLSAPAPGLVEGQRVRNKVTGQMGTVTNGAIVPDPDWND